nr:MAG TPA: hypothetical protein [Caudoviricetes sp.]DAX79311.1 MAG TPA: hypothetical protein [Caudoviricetes sp.]
MPKSTEIEEISNISLFLPKPNIKLSIFAYI